MVGLGSDYGGQVGIGYQAKTWVSWTSQQSLSRFMTQTDVSGPSL